MVTLEYDVNKGCMKGTVIKAGGCGCVILPKKIFDGTEDVFVKIYENTKDATPVEMWYCPVKKFGNSLAVFLPKRFISKIAEVAAEKSRNDSMSGCVAVDLKLSEDYCSGICDNCVFWYADSFLFCPAESLKNDLPDLSGTSGENTTHNNTYTQ
jgi:putative transposon-encoded protein